MYKVLCTFLQSLARGSQNQTGIELNNLSHIVGRRRLGESEYKLVWRRRPDASSTAQNARRTHDSHPDSRAHNDCIA